MDGTKDGGRGARRPGLALGLALCGCAAPGSDVHLAPLYTSVATAAGGQETELLAGALRVRRPAPEAPASEWIVGPLAGADEDPDERNVTRFLVPLGSHRVFENESVTRLLPIFHLHREVHLDAPTEWRLLAVPGILWGRDNEGRTFKAVFPFGGVMEHFFSYDRIEFALFPLYVKTQRGRNTIWNLLFPVFAFSTGPGPEKRRFWPFYGHTNAEGRFRRMFVMWPFFHYHVNHLERPPEQVSRQWMVWPFVGRTRRGSFTATTWLWPFFGWASNPETGFWAWDGPAPFVRIQRPGTSGEPTRTRLWPFYSRFHNDEVDIRYFPWPLVSHRREHTRVAEREAFYAIPFWQSWDRTGAGGETSSWRKLWPLWQSSHEPGQSREAALALNPFGHNGPVEQHFRWIWEIWATERRGRAVSERSLAGLYRRESDPLEDRRSLSFLWSRRRYGEGPARVTETSLLLGLLRWRSGPAGTELLRPAFPGPGWPAWRPAPPPQDAP